MIILHVMQSTAHGSGTSAQSPESSSLLVVRADAEFEARWAAWLAKGRAHEQRARRRFCVFAGVLGSGAAILYVVVLYGFFRV